jgi:hypothetical protein
MLCATQASKQVAPGAGKILLTPARATCGRLKHSPSLSLLDLPSLGPTGGLVRGPMQRPARSAAVHDAVACTTEAEAAVGAAQARAATVLARSPAGATARTRRGGARRRAALERGSRSRERLRRDRPAPLRAKPPSGEARSRSTRVTSPAAATARSSRSTRSPRASASTVWRWRARASGASRRSTGGRQPDRHRSRLRVVSEFAQAGSGVC